MRFFIFTVLTLFTTCAEPTKSTRTDVANDDENGLNILRGERLDGGLYPFVGILRNTQAATYCTGTLVKPDIVLTAAHCLAGVAPASLEFTVGNEVAIGAALTVHPGYNLTAESVDIGILRLAVRLATPPLDFNTSVYTGTPLPPGSSALMIGFGFTNTTWDGEYKQRGVVTLKGANYTLAGVENGRIEVTHGPTGQIGCQGDSGSPLFSQDGKLLGIDHAAI